MKFTLPKPLSLNQLYGTNQYTGGKYITDKGKSFLNMCHDLIYQQNPKRETISKPVKLYVELYYCGRYDIDNCLKILQDMFTKEGVWIDDSQIDHLEVIKHRIPHRKDEKVEVEITQL